jgi:Protein of unknown function (DUF4242)
VTEYIIELYVSRSDAVEVLHGAERARLAAEEQTRAGTPVRYLRSIYIPEDETCFLLFDAVSADAVRTVAALAALSWERVSTAIENEATPS